MFIIPTSSPEMLAARASLGRLTPLNVQLGSVRYDQYRPQMLTEAPQSTSFDLDDPFAALTLETPAEIVAAADPPPELMARAVRRRRESLPFSPILEKQARELAETISLKQKEEREIREKFLATEGGAVHC